jgi:hypothetical protein
MLYNEKISDLYSSLSVVRVVKLRRLLTMGQAYSKDKILQNIGGKNTGKRQLGKSARWEYSIKRT